MSTYVQGPSDRVCHVAVPGAGGTFVWTYCDRAYKPTSLKQLRHTRPDRVCKKCEQREPNR